MYLGNTKYVYGPRKPDTQQGYSIVQSILNPPLVAVRRPAPTYAQRHQYVLHGSETGLRGYNTNHGPQLDGFGASISPVAAGGAVGTVFGPIGTAVGSLIGMGVGLLSGKAHYSPWNFLYDDYPQHIYENEITINSLRNAIARYTGAPQTPDPPIYSKKGGAQYQASMQAIVPRYVPGSESQIAAYDRRLNEAGGAYETTVKMQIAAAPQLQSQLQGLQQTSQPLPIQPSSGSALAIPGQPPLVSSQYNPRNANLPNPFTYSAPFVPPQYQPPQYQIGPVMSSPGSYAPSAAPLVEASMFGAGGYMPYVIGGLGLLFLLMDRQTQQSYTKSFVRSRNTPRTYKG